MKKYHFTNTIYAVTDSIYPTQKYVVIGLYCYPIDKDIHEESGYYTLDEVQQFYEEGRTTDNLIYCDGSFELRRSDLSFITKMTIVNGVSLRTKDEKWITYGKKVGLIHTEPISQPMMAGNKTLVKMSEDKYLIQYQLNCIALGIQMSSPELEKQIESFLMGYWNKAKHENNQITFSSISFESLTLNLELTKSEVVDSTFNHALIQMDLQVYYMFHSNLDWTNHLIALMQCARDNGQFHLLNESFEQKNTLSWYTDK